MAILLAIISFRTIVKSRSVQILSDNITSIAYVNHKVGSYPVSNSFTKNHINLNRRGQQWDVHSTRAYCRSQKPCSRLLVAYSIKAQLDASPQTPFLHRSNIEPSNNRQICTLSQYKLHRFNSRRIFKNISVNGHDSGTTLKYEMAIICREDICRNGLTR